MWAALQNTMQIISTWVGVRQFSSVRFSSVQFISWDERFSHEKVKAIELIVSSLGKAAICMVPMRPCQIENEQDNYNN